MKLKIELLKNQYSVYKFCPEYIVKDFFQTVDFYSITKTKDETSIVAEEGLFNDYIKAENGWRVLKIAGILDFSLIGILRNISKLLAEKNIGIFVISTYNTDYIMVKKSDINDAIKILKENEYEISE